MKKLMFVVLFILTGCKQELYSSLNEKEANQMQALLISNKIDVIKKKNKDGFFSISVDELDFVRSVNVLNINGLPKNNYVNAESIFPSGQLVTSPLQEKARLTYLKEQNIERLMSTVPGVLESNVVLTMEDKNQPASVSVIIISSPLSNIQSINYQLKELIRNSIGDIQSENITLVIRQYAQFQS
ncbi:EscJ/YscJ/HrcJ family type III secretion inner membrane ring protein [Salmonella enterica]|nr:EscJ/YscJ/HrcJ family type III secretion inner membrane ring protein [Salmonella enterica]